MRAGMVAEQASLPCRSVGPAGRGLDERLTRPEKERPGSPTGPGPEAPSFISAAVARPLDVGSNKIKLAGLRGRRPPRTRALGNRKRKRARSREGIDGIVVRFRRPGDLAPTSQGHADRGGFAGSGLSGNDSQLNPDRGGG